MLSKADTENVVSATDAKNNLGALISRVADDGQSVIIERQGKPRAAIISMDEYCQFRELQKDAKRRDAIANLKRLRDEISKNFEDLSQEEIDAIAQDVRSDVTRRLFESGTVRYAAE